MYSPWANKFAPTDTHVAMSRRHAIILRITLVLCFAVNSAVAADTSELIRASIIEKITKFIEWPSYPDQNFTLCVAGNPPLLPALQTYYANVSIVSKPVKLLIISDLKSLAPCQAIYLDGESNELAKILKITSNNPILVIAEKENAVSSGAHVDFFIEEDRLHLEANRTALTNSGFKVSYHLLKAAHIVD